MRRRPREAVVSDALNAVIERLQRAEAPDRKLDREILRVISGRIVRDEIFIGGAKDGTREIATASPFKWACLLAPRYTASFDAALTLVPPHHLWQVKQGIQPEAIVWMLKTDYDDR